MGKCFSAVNRGQRNKSDFYQTPYSMTIQLLENEKFDKDKNFFEPAYGNGAIYVVLERYSNLYVLGKNFDINNGCCFFDVDISLDYIITNPPFSLALEFIQKAKEVATEKFAMLLPLSYLHGQERFEKKIFTDPGYPLTKIYVFTRYPLLESKVREDGKYKTGMIAYAWYLWEKNKNNKPFDKYLPAEIHWINNQQYILSKNDKE